MVSLEFENRLFYSNFCLGKFSACCNKWMVNDSLPSPQGMAGRVLSTIAVKEMIPQIPGYGFHDGRVIFLKIILPPSEWFWIVKPFVHLFNKTHRSGKQSLFPYSCLETLLGDRLLLLVLKGGRLCHCLRKMQNDGNHDGFLGIHL